MYYYIKVEGEILRTSSHHTWGIRHLYHVKDIDRGYRLVMDKRERIQLLEDKSKMKIALEANMSRDERVKGEKGWKKFGYNITNNSREVLLLDNKNGKTVLADEIVKDMTTLKKLDVF